MNKLQPDPRIDAEWIALSAFRELLKISTKGSMSKSTYAEAFEFGAALYPALLGDESSILRQANESNTAREYRQRARLKSEAAGNPIHPLGLLDEDISELVQLLELAKKSKEKGRVDQLKNRLKTLRRARDEIAPPAHTETQLIARDTNAFPAGLPTLGNGKGYKAFELPDGNALRVHIFHPDKPEHVSGADVLYERHDPSTDSATLVFVQYKIWEKQSLSLNDPRMQSQLAKLKSVVCDGGLCTIESVKAPYRFPHCAAFLRPTDKLQNPDQKLISSGEHLPICKIEECAKTNRFNTPVLDFDGVRRTSLSGTAFEYMFTYNKVGSRPVPYEELEQLYHRLSINAEPGNLLVHAQEFELAFGDDEA
ncbi:hypothetical protein [Methylophilus sp. YYY-1]|uniref:hypothetical protein n=1 Tax=Methylophilus sp. YYY-1 TaxID=2682087 RepID=UPI0023B29EFD|nr:hypothetical protein [Methylophilus sp. YYY-1]MDF0378440.1 hypothetical protein [Methylophilus sp. YYY-1]